MEKDVIISIKGTQKYDGGEPGAVELVTAGRLSPFSNHTRVAYTP